MEVLVRSEQPADVIAIRRLHDAAFGGPAEGRLVDALRRAGCFSPETSLVAVAGGDVVGHVLFSRVGLEVEGRDVQAAALAPLAVLPSRRRIGVGSRLVREGLARLEAHGYRAVIVVGDPAYYARFGFSRALAAPLGSPYAGPHQQALALVPGTLDAARTGRVIYPAPFAEVA
jgi:putative acetyltransferase